MPPTPSRLARAALCLPKFVRLRVGRRARRHTQRFEADLPDALDLLAGSLEAGSSFVQAMELVAEEGDGPVAEAFERILSENSLGTPIATALASAASRMGSRDFAWLANAVAAQQEYGASLADLMRTLAESLRWRDEMRREMRALTAEGRISAWILIALPFALAGFFAFANPGYLGTLISSPAGWVMLAIAAGFMTIGTLWMRRIVREEV